MTKYLENTRITNQSPFTTEFLKSMIDKYYDYSNYTILKIFAGDNMVVVTEFDGISITRHYVYYEELIQLKPETLPIDVF